MDIHEFCRGRRIGRTEVSAVTFNMGLQGSLYIYLDREDVAAVVLTPQEAVALARMIGAYTKERVDIDYKPGRRFMLTEATEQ